MAVLRRIVERLKASRRTRWRAAGGCLAVVAALGGLLWFGRSEKKVARARGPLLGKPAPNLIDHVELWLNGDEVGLAGLKGHPVLLFFWHPRDEAGNSLAALPHVRSLASALASEGLVTIGLCVLDGPKEAEPVLREHGITFRIGLDCDADLHRAYRIEATGTPYCYLVDGRGIIAWEGPPEDLTERAVRACPR